MVSLSLWPLETLLQQLHRLFVLVVVRVLLQHFTIVQTARSLNGLGALVGECRVIGDCAATVANLRDAVQTSSASEMSRAPVASSAYPQATTRVHCAASSQPAV